MAEALRQGFISWSIVTTGCYCCSPPKGGAGLFVVPFPVPSIKGAKKLSFFDHMGLDFHGRGMNKL